MREFRVFSRATIVAAFMLLAVPFLASQASAALPLPPAVTLPTFQTKTDESGADDLSGQKDLSLHGVATPAPGDLWAMWQWDDLSWSGGNTGDACALFDTDSDARVNFSLCVSVGGNPAVQQPGSPRIWTCNDSKVQTCPQSAQVTPINTACATNRDANDPFHNTGNSTKDTQAICHIDLADVGGGTTAKLINTCSYPSQSPTSSPSDCVLVPRDAFLIIQKIVTTTPSTDGTFPFRLGTGAAAANAVQFTASGSQTSGAIPIVSGVDNNLKEDVPTNWAIDTPAPSCTGASGTGSSNGTVSGDTISGIKTASDTTVTCVYRDKKQTGAIKITKVRSGTSGAVTLAGAKFRIDGGAEITTGADGTVCADGLSIASHSVEETHAPAGHTLASPATQNVSVTAAGTCAAGSTQATVTFSDPLVLGTINITKKKADGTALAGAVFTLYSNVAPLTGDHTGAGDTIQPSLTCTSSASGACQIANVPLGNYWIVETTTPAGFATADDTPVTIDVGATEGNGDVEAFNITDATVNGTINVHKAGFGGADLAGATFTLYVDNAIVGEFNILSDTATSKTCGPTSAAGNCQITGVAPGDYFLVETTTPPGYDTAAPVPVHVGLGSGANAGDVVNVPTISDPVVKGTINITKTGTGNVILNGATFTLYNDADPAGSTFDAQNDTSTGKTCTTSGSGTCSITDVTPGNYWVRETTTPNGYDTAPDQKVNVGIGTSAHVGDTDGLSFVDPVVNGTVAVTKTDDAGTPNPLSGAVFTLYTNVTPLTGDHTGAGDTITTKTCTTGTLGTCNINDVPPGNYWVVETTTPAGYLTAADKAVTVGIGNTAPHVGDTVPVTLVDARKHRVVVLVCHEGTDTLHSRDVTVGGVRKQSLSGTGLTAAEQKALCDLGGASFGNLGTAADPKPDVNALVELSKVNGATG
jgi:hypothetical protein